MKRLLILILGCTWMYSLWGQNGTPPEVLNLEEVLQKIGYPMEAKNAHVGGKVVAKVKVGTNGKVETYEILESSSPVLADAVKAHIEDLKFRPAKNNGEAVAAYMQVPFRFELPESTSFNDLEAALASTGDVEALDLSSKNLTAVDSRVARLSSLRDLNLEDNQLTTVPGFIAKLSMLEHLSLADNQLTSIPSSLKKLKNLKTLDISGNKLTEEQIRKVREQLEDVDVMGD